MEQDLSSETFWCKAAIFLTAVSLFALIVLSIGRLRDIAAASTQVPAFSVINQRLDYVFDEHRGMPQTRVGPAEPLFGRVFTEPQAEAIVRRGKLAIQAKNCMDCHTLLGNGAHYAPDLTRAWLDPYWTSKQAREHEMVLFLLDPSDKQYNRLGHRMPNLRLTPEEARSIVAFLKWMSSIDANGLRHDSAAPRQES